MQPETLRFKVAEPLLLLGKQRFANVDIRIRVKGGGHVSQIYGELHIVQALVTIKVTTRQARDVGADDGHGQASPRS